LRRLLHPGPLRALRRPPRPAVRDRRAAVPLGRPPRRERRLPGMRRPPPAAAEGSRPPAPAPAALVVPPPGAEPVADGGYGAVLLLDTWALLTRADLRAGEEAARRWFAAAALAKPKGT